MEKEITLAEFEPVCEYILDNNKRLIEQGIAPVAIGLEAEAGIGKSSIIEEIAAKRGMTYVKLNLSELEEVGDLTGFPITEYYVAKGDKGGWVSEKVLGTFINKGYNPTNKTRLAYAQPAWLPEKNDNGCILNLDDYSRAGKHFIQATMELINTGKYRTWSLPENTTIMLTSNPDNGNYDVTTLDAAQKSRFVNFRSKFDIDCWALWAEGTDLDNRTINFAIAYPELFEKLDANKDKIVNARSYTTFCKIISGIDNWENDKSLAMILTIAKGCFNDDDNHVGRLFSMFIKHRLDKLIPPKEMLFGNWKEVSKKIENCVYDAKGEYHAEIASLLATRILNYCIVHFNKAGSKTEPIETRLIEMIDSQTLLFTEDIIFHIIRHLVTNYRSRTNKLIMNPKISSKLIRNE